MGVIIKVKLWFRYLVLKRIRPEIIGGWKNANGVFSENTGISNMTHVSQKSDNLFIGDHVFIGHFNYIDGNNAKLYIGDHVQITNYVNVLTHSSHHEIRMNNCETLCNETYQNLLQIGDVFIGDNSYIGPHSVIMPGTTIGKGCIISAYSYVKGEFSDFSIIRGIPAKVIGDTRKVDAELLEKYPDLLPIYYMKNENN